MIAPLETLELALLLGVWFALNMSMIRDWVSQRSKHSGVDR